LDDLAINRNGIISYRLHIGVKSPEGGVVLKEVGSLFNASSIVDDNNVKGRFLPAMPAPEEVSSNPSKSIDCYLKLCLNYSFLPTSAPTNLNTIITFQFDVIILMVNAKMLQNPIPCSSQDNFILRKFQLISRSLLSFYHRLIPTYGTPTRSYIKY